MNREMEFQIECLTAELIRSLMDDYGWNMQRAMDELYASETFQRIENPKTGLYYQSTVYVYQFLKNEIETGVMA